MKSDQLYKNVSSLAPIQKVLGEADKALENRERVRSEDVDINETLVAAGGVGAGAGIGFAGLYFGGTVGLSAAGITSGLAAAGSLVGGGMVAGIGVVAAPAVLLGVGGYALISKRNKRKLTEKKEMLLQEALRKQNSIISELHKKAEFTEQRVDYLTNLNTLLKAIINDLESDLKAA